MRAQLDHHREIQHARNGRVVHRQDGAVGRGRRKLLGEPVELGIRHQSVVSSRHGGVDRDDAQPVDVVHPVDRIRGRHLPEQFTAEGRPVVVVAHHPDDFRSHAGSGRIDDGAQLRVRLSLALIGEVTGEDDGFGPASGCLELRDQLNQPGFAVDLAVQRLGPGYQMRVTEVEDEVVGTSVLRPITGHSLTRPSFSCQQVNNVRRVSPQSGLHCADFAPRGDARVSVDSQSCVSLQVTG